MILGVNTLISIIKTLTETFFFFLGKNPLFIFLNFATPIIKKNEYKEEEIYILICNITYHIINTNVRHSNDY